MIDKTGILSRIPLFEKLSEKQIESVAEITSSRMMAKKEMLFHSGTPGTEVYILVQGAVQLYNITEAGKEVVIKVVKPGEMFGEAILFERRTFPVSAVILKQSQIFSFKRADFLHLLDNPAFRDAFIGQIMAKMRYLTQQYHSLSSLDVVDRLLAFFKEHHGDSQEFTVGISKKDVAAAIGTTSETLSRTIKKLQNCNVLKWEGKKVTLINLARCKECVK